MRKNNTTTLGKGLHTDSSIENQPENTASFTLNGVNRSSEGDYNVISNEQSNKINTLIPLYFTIIGKEYISENKIALFLVKNNETTSEIGIFHPVEEVYVTHVNDEEQEEKLNFKLKHQIDATYRLRRGCEDTIYFTDNFNKPRYFNFSKKETFKNSDGTWNIDKFNLLKTYDNIPEFLDISVSSNGNLEAGSYNFSIQYLDEDLNPTEWIKVTDTVIIYNDNYSSNFQDIRGSTNEISDLRDFGKTNKSIHIELDNLDEDYLFYRIAIIKSNNGSGEINEVAYTEKYSTKQTEFIYTGNEDFEKGTIEEINSPPLKIQTVEHIEQNENRLLLSNTKGKQVNWCKLQKYASKIQADLVLKEIILDDITQEGNPKRGEVHTEFIGYQPGEIYSFAIAYVFEDGCVSPLYHIPGRNHSLREEHIFRPETELSVKALSTDNKSTTDIYLDNEFCDDYWGKDSEGEDLVNTNIRHHRFPLRSKISEPVVYDDTITTFYEEDIPGSGDILIKITGELDPMPEGIVYLHHWTYPPHQLYTTYQFDFTDYDPLVGAVGVAIRNNGSGYNMEASYPLSYYDSLEYIIENLNEPNYATVGGIVYIPEANFEYYIDEEVTTKTVATESKGIKKSKIYGIKFSNIELPISPLPKKEKVVGYYIYRNKREESDKTILDNGILHPTTLERNYVALGHLNPQAHTNNFLYGILHPEHKFFNREYNNTEYYTVEGQYHIQGSLSTQTITQDVMAGTSYDPEISRNRERDADGFDLHVLSRTNILKYSFNSNVTTLNNDKTFYLDALSYHSEEINGETKKIYNVSSDNKTGVVFFENGTNDIGKLPYVIMHRPLNNPYSNFRIKPFYSESTTMFTDENCTIFNGDSYISSMRYTNSFFYDIRLRRRDTKSGFWNLVLGVLAVIGGVALTATGNVAGGLMLLGFGTSQVATGIKKETIAKTYSEEYDAGLRDAVNDGLTSSVFSPNPADDEVQWFSDHLVDVWVESAVNMNWRMGQTAGLTDFLNAPVQSVYNSSVDNYMIDKLTILDTESSSGRLYKGYANAELYDINLDYTRRREEKTHYHLPLEYDCCSDCFETFPHRIHYSEQSFQEELSDNYRNFLPNNYTDIQGENGVITDLFALSNTIYVHTEQALYKLPHTYQERVVGDVLSFIGTGSFLEMPPKEIIDDDSGNSAGTQHKWATLKTPQGVFFISERQRKIYQFNGNGLKSISSIGMDNWFRNNIEIKTDKFYLQNKNQEYPYRNNPSNIYGTGYISAYDSLNQRVLVTKKDLQFKDEDIREFIEPDAICGNDRIVFTNKEQTIEDMEDEGWTYLGIENCELQFKKIEVITTTETVEHDYKKNDFNVFVEIDHSGSYAAPPGGEGAHDALIQTLQTFDQQYRNVVNPDWTGEVFFVFHGRLLNSSHPPSWTFGQPYMHTAQSILSFLTKVNKGEDASATMPSIFKVGVANVIKQGSVFDTGGNGTPYFVNVNDSTVRDELFLGKNALFVSTTNENEYWVFGDSPEYGYYDKAAGGTGEYSSLHWQYAIAGDYSGGDLFRNLVLGSSAITQYTPSLIVEEGFIEQRNNLEEEFNIKFNALVASPVSNDTDSNTFISSRSGYDVTAHHLKFLFKMLYGDELLTSEQYNHYLSKPNPTVDNVSGWDNFMLAIQTNQEVLHNIPPLINEGWDMIHDLDYGNITSKFYGKLLDKVNEFTETLNYTEEVTTSTEIEHFTSIEGEKLEDDLILCTNSEEIIEEQEALGWSFVNQDGNNLNFKRTTYVDVIKKAQTKEFKNDMAIFFTFDTSSSFYGPLTKSIESAIASWKTAFKDLHPDWDESVYLSQAMSRGTERYLLHIAYVKYGISVTDDQYNPVTLSDYSDKKNIYVISFFNETDPDYYTLSDDDSITNEYMTDFNLFTTIRQQFADEGKHLDTTFMPVATENSGLNYLLIKQAIRAYEGGELEDLSSYNNYNSYFSQQYWEAVLQSATEQSYTDPYPVGIKQDYTRLNYHLKYDSVTGGGELSLNESILHQHLFDVIDLDRLTKIVDVEYTVKEPVIEEKTIVCGDTVITGFSQNSWTTSFDFNQWISFHSYLPNMYLSTENKMFSWLYNNNGIYEHNVAHHFQEYYGKKYPFVIEFVSKSKDINSKIWDYIQFYTSAKKYDEESECEIEEELITFNKALFYNSNQISGMLNLKVKDENITDDYMMNQVNNHNVDEIKLDRNERTWSLNNLRDIRKDYKVSMFKKDTESLKDEYFIDKVVNEDNIDYYKDWNELQPFRDKYLCVRLIFDNFEDVNLFFQFSNENLNTSIR